MSLFKAALIFIIFFSLSIDCGAQITAANKAIITNQLLKRINDLRQEVGVDALILDPKLVKPAEIHSIYMAKNNRLSHSHINKKFNTPAKRVEHFAPIEFDIVGENILQSKPVKLPLNKNTAIELADNMFEAWKNSLGHYANMIESEFDVCNFGYKLDRNKQVYATNVFGRKGIKIENQLSSNAFSLSDGNDESCFERYPSNILVNIGNAMSIEGGDIFLHYHDKAYFKKLFSGPKDGIAIDIIEYDQLACDTQNRLDISRIYDGVLLEPVYRDEIIKNNTAESDYRLISRVGTIPNDFVGKSFTMTVLLIKDGYVCKRVIPNVVPRASYPLKPIEPKLESLDGIQLKERDNIESLNLSFQFKTNQTQPVEFPEIPIQDENILAVKIKSYSSIDGNEEYNIELHKKRAKVIKDYISKSVRTKDSLIEIETKENWDEFYFQLKLCFADSLLVKSKQELRDMASSKNVAILPWVSLLSEQRKSSATFYYESKKSQGVSQSDLYSNNLKYAIVNTNIDLAKKVIFEMYNNEGSSLGQLFDESNFEFLMNEPELVQNTAAILTKCYNTDVEQSIRFINKWLTSETELDVDAKFNLLILYTIVNNKLLKKWDLPSQRLANVVNPKYIDQILDEGYSNELMLNIHLTFIKYYGQINDGINISKSFNFISNYFETRALAIDDGIALCKFYNRWSRYDLTIKYLLSRYDENDLNEDAIFLLLKTMDHYSDDHELTDYEEIYLDAMEYNLYRWCSWVDNNIQLTRDRKIKGIYCSKCNGHSHN